MSTVLITGANRGIGLALAEHYADAGWRVLAACRDPDRAFELAGLGDAVTVHPMDVAEPDSIAAAADAVAGEAVDLLINNAGTYGSDGQSFGTVDPDGWAYAFRVNAMGPLLVTEAFLDHLERGSARLVACVSSRMGSIADGGGGYYQYRSSKAALNMVARGMARDLSGRRITVVVFHPGWVRTAMGGSSAPLAPAKSAASMAKVLARLKPSDSGKFLNYDGSSVPW